MTKERADHLARSFSSLSRSCQRRVDLCAQSSVQIGDRGYSLEIYSVTHDKVRFPGQDMDMVSLTDDGAWICSRIAKDFGLEAGARVAAGVQARRIQALAEDAGPAVGASRPAGN